MRSINQHLSLFLMTITLDLGEISLSDSQISGLNSYMSILLEWNKKIRLTGYNNLQDIQRNLVHESILAFTATRPSLTTEPHLDFGSGNGTPGLVFSILDSSRSFVLIEKIEKKRIFMEYVIRHLDLKNVQVLPALRSAVLSPTVWMKAITISDFLNDTRTREYAIPPFRFYRFGCETHPSCNLVRTYAINGRIKNWQENHSLNLTESVFQG